MATDTPIARRLASVAHIIIVLAGKGGVGKSSISAQLALALYSSSPRARVGVLDVDLTGPSVPRMLGVDGAGVMQSADGWVPVYADGPGGRMGCMSVGFLLKRREDSVVWRGPKKNAMIRQFLGDVRWGELDYLVVDTPPGTSDEHLALLEHLAPLQSKLSSVIVTTPQAVALLDAHKCLSFTRAVGLPVLGLVENMSGYACPCCGDVAAVFSTGGGEAMARAEGLRFLGAMPVDARLVEVLDAAEPGEEERREGEEREKGAGELENGAMQESFKVMERYRATTSSRLFENIAGKIVQALSEAEGSGATLPPAPPPRSS